MHPNNRRLVHTKCPSRQLRCRAIVQHTAITNAATRGGLHVSVHTLHAAMFHDLFSGACLPGFAVWISRFGLAGRESRGQPAAALGGARALRPPSSAGYSWATQCALHGTHSHGVLSGYTATGQYAARNALLSAEPRPPSCSCRLERVCANDRIYPLQGLELLVTVLLARNRPPPPTVAAGVPHAELAAELLTLPSGLLVTVCEAIVKLTVRLGAACACV